MSNNANIGKVFNLTGDRQVTRLGNIEDTADIKEVPAKGDYIPVIDSEDGGQVKKTPVAAIQGPTLTAGRSVELKQEGGTLEIGAVVPGKNLLINWYFRKPVNRNGKTEYRANEYSIDRWMAVMGGPTVLGGITVENGCILVSPDYVPSQPVEDYQQLLNTQLTASVLTDDGTLFSGTLILGLNNQDVFISTPEMDVYITSFGWFQIYCHTEQRLVAAKLELGDHQTLARQNEDGGWELIDPPDYDLQYLLCSQYSPTTGEWVGSQHSNPNLLDNWYFADPVNQRGQTEYTQRWTYSIDRWIIHDNSALTVNDGFITVSGSFYQPFEDLPDGQYTVSVLTTSGLVTATASIVKTSDAQDVVYLPSVGLFVREPTGNWVMRIELSSNTSQIIAAKLELGPVQTLAHKEGDTWVLNDPPPNKALELAKCQRYYFRSQTLDVVFSEGMCDTTKFYANVNVNFPVTMRGTPAVSVFSVGQDGVVTDGKLVSAYNGNYIENSVSAHFVTRNGFSLLRADEEPFPDEIFANFGYEADANL